MQSASVSTIAPGLAGRVIPKNTMLTLTSSASMTVIRRAWTTICAASTQYAGTGVVDRRRKMPSSR